MEPIINAPQETIEDNTSDHSNTNCNVELINQATIVLIKGKRTKRPRPSSPIPGAPIEAPIDSSSVSTVEEATGCITEEDEDLAMANCLILLSQGDQHRIDMTEKFTSRRFTETITTTAGHAGFYVYECKTCNKCFPTFQALGGHRASHKKPKLAPSVGDQTNPVFDENMLQISMNSFSKIANQNSKGKVHECSICRAEFNSGQALGGHMRRHRPLVHHDQQNALEFKKERSSAVSLSLDLNLPAPSEDELQKPPPSTDFKFSGKPELALSLSPSALVDCHY